jgi:hypothetical protein
MGARRRFNIKCSRLTHPNLNHPGIIVFVLNRRSLLIGAVEKRNPHLYAKCTSGEKNLFCHLLRADIPHRYLLYPLGKVVCERRCNKVPLD